MEKVIRAHSELVCILDANVEYWLHVDDHIPHEIEHAEEHKQLVSAEHEEESQKTAKLKGELPPEGTRCSRRNLTVSGRGRMRDPATG